MSLVRELPRFSQPGHCIMFAGRRRDDRGFYLFDNVLDGVNGDVHIGISGEALRTIVARHGRHFGLAWLEDVQRAEAERNEANARVAELESQVAELEQFKESLSGVAAAGFEIKRRQGRPPRKKED